MLLLSLLGQDLGASEKMFKKIILYFLLMMSIFSMSLKEKEIINKNKILKEYTGQIILFGDYEKKDGLTYDRKTGELFTGRTVVIDNKKVVGATAEYVDGRKNGVQYDYYLSGKLKVQTELKNGKNEGYQYRYDEKGNLGIKVEYKEGKIQEMEVYPVAIISKNNPTGFNNIKFIATSENRGIMTTYKDNLKLTEAEAKIVDHESATLAQDGKTTHFYPNGNVKIILTKKDNMTEGKILTYSEAGNLLIETNAKNNKQDGEVIIYHANGQVQLHCDRLVGDRVRGNCEIYDEKGTLLHEGYFDNVSLDVLRKEKTGEIKNTKELMEVINRYM